MKKIAFLFLLLFSFSLAKAQNAADVETSFGSIPGFDKIIYATAQQPDGKILVGGDFTTYKGVACKMLVRLLPNGNIDPDFVTEVTFYFKISSIVLQPDGKILVVGGYDSFAGIKDGIIRLNSDGSTDTTFSTIFGFSGMSNIQKIVLQPDGKIIAVGPFTTYGSVNRNKIVRINSDGSLDTSFDPGSGFNSSPLSIVLQPDGKMVVVGSFSNYNGYTRNRIIRLNPDASVDLTFSIGVGFNGFYGNIHVLLQPDSKIVVAGSFSTYKNVTQNGIIRLFPDGSHDTSFNIGTGFTYTDGQGINDIDMDTTGNFILGGGIASYNGTTKYYCIRLFSDGTLDNSFSVDNSSVVYCITIQNDQKLLLGGNNYFSRVNYNGTFDYSFDYGTGFNNSFNYNNNVLTALQPDGKIIVGGKFTLYGLHTQLGLVRLNADGSKDSAFDVSYLDMCNIENMIVQPDGKIIVQGTFRYANSGPGNNFISKMRLNTDGTQDTSYNTTGLLYNFTDYAIQSDGKILMCGGYQIKRMNSDGTPDITFNIGSGFNGAVNAITIQPDGKIIAVGEFTLFNGEQHQRIVRLLPNGNLDTSFNTGEGLNNSGTALYIQADGKILVGGNFNAYNLIYAWGIVRINPDGSIDNTFTTGYNIRDIKSIIRQTDGKIVVGGYRGYLVGNYLPNLMRFNADGSVDYTFDIGTGFDSGDINSYVSKLHLQPDGKIIVSGAFKDYKTIGSSKIVRLYGGNPVLSNDVFIQDKIVLFPNPAHEIINLTLPNKDFGNFSCTIVDTYGKIVHQNNTSQSSINIQSLEKGIYFLKINTESGDYVSKFIKK